MNYPAISFPPIVDPPVVQDGNFSDNKAYRARTDGQIRALQQAFLSLLAAGATFPPGTTDAAGGAVVVAANVASWNRSASTSVQNVYALPADTLTLPHTIGWQSGLAPLVTAPAGWKILDPSNGELSAMGGTYLYGSGGSPTGETYDWVADIADEIYWAK